MSTIAIVTDTDSSLPAALAAQYHIRQVPILIHFGAEAFKTSEELDDTRLFDRINRENKLPTTAAPSPGQFVEAFQAAFAEGAQAVICICVSSGVSATYQAACSARDLLPDRDITVMDSQTLSMAQGFTVLAAAEAARAGASQEEIVARVQSVRDRSRLLAALPTLKYLAMSGRVGHLAAGLATVLNIQPILTVQNGKLDLLERVRTRSKAWARTIELAVAAAGGRPVERLAIIHVNVPAQAHEFEAQLRASLPYTGEVVYAELTPGLSVHAGAGLVGLVMVTGQ